MNHSLSSAADGILSYFHLTTQHRMFTTVQPRHVEEEHTSIFDSLDDLKPSDSAKLASSSERNGVMSLDYRWDGQRYITAGEDSSIRIFDESTKSEILRFSPSILGHTQRLFCARWACSSTHWNEFAAATDVSSASHAANAGAMADFSNVLFSGGWDSHVCAWDIRIGHTPALHVQGPTLSGSDALDFSPLPTALSSFGLLATASFAPKSALSLWDLRQLRTPLVTTSMSSSVMTTSAASVGASPQHLVIGIDHLYCVRFIDNFKRICVSATGRDGALVLPIANPSEITKIPLGFFGGCFTMSNYSNRIVCCGAEGRLSLFNL